MDNFVRAAGFKELVMKKRKFSGMLRAADENTGAKRKMFTTEDYSRTECYRYCGRNFGFAAYYSRNNHDEMQMKRWVAFAESEHNILINDINVEKSLDGNLYAFCEEEHTGSEFEFRINNVLEYRKKWARYKRNGAPYSVNVAGLASYGTILLPVMRDEHKQKERECENEEYKSLLERARGGDIYADDMLCQRAKETATDIRERLKKDDLFTVFEGFLLPVSDEDGVFAVLGDITRVDSDYNEVTGERVLKFSLDVSGAIFTVFVNESDLFGMPMVDMRFMGICKLQGSINFDI